MQTVLQAVSSSGYFYNYKRQHVKPILQTAIKLKNSKTEVGCKEGKVGIFMFHGHTEETSLKGLKDMVSNQSYIICCCNIKLKRNFLFLSLLFFNCIAHNNTVEVGLKVLRLCKTSTRLGGLNSLNTVIASTTKTYFLK